MLDLNILFPSLLNGITTGAVYALIALGLTLIYGVLHIINFAHGAALMVAVYGVYMLKENLWIDPWLALATRIIETSEALERLIRPEPKQERP